jgi:hypothetical protein
MGRFANEHLIRRHKIPQTQIGMGVKSEMEALRKAFNEANAPEPEPAPLLDVDEIQVKRDRMAHAREVAKANREARRVQATGSQT